MLAPPTKKLSAVKNIEDVTDNMYDDGGDNVGSVANERELEIAGTDRERSDTRFNLVPHTCSVSTECHNFNIKGKR